MSLIKIMALRHSAFYSPLLVTMGGGYLRQEGLEYDYCQASPELSIPDAIATDQIHVAQSAVATSWIMREQGKTPPYVHFAQINQRDGFYLTSRAVVEKFNWTDLEGKTVLVDHLFQPLAMFQYVLQQKGVDIRKVEIIDAGDVLSMDRAFRDGMGDYVHQQGPAPQQLENDGVGHIVASVGEVIGEIAFSSLCASREWLLTDMARAFMRAYRKARQFVMNAPGAEIADIVLPFLQGIDRKVLNATIEDYKKLGTWSVAAEISEHSYMAAQQIFLAVGMQKQAYPYAEIIVEPPG